jgi:hypothetical protein
MEQKYIFLLLLTVTISLFIYNIYSVYYSTFRTFIPLNNKKNFFTNDEKQNLVEILEKYNSRIDNASKLDTYDSIHSLLESNTIDNEPFEIKKNTNLDEFNKKMGSLLEHSINEQFTNPPIKENLVLQSHADPELSIEAAYLEDANCYILSINGGCLSFKNNRLVVDKKCIGNPRNEHLWLINTDTVTVTVTHKDNPAYLCVYKDTNGLSTQTQLKLKGTPTNNHEHLFNIVPNANNMLL